MFRAVSELTEGGFDHILEQLMQQAGPQGPIPASDTVIEGLPRSKLTEESLGQLPGSQTT